GGGIGFGAVVEDSQDGADLVLDDAVGRHCAVAEFGEDDGDVGVGGVDSEFALQAAANRVFDRFLRGRVSAAAVRENPREGRLVQCPAGEQDVPAGIENVRRERQVQRCLGG